MAERGVLEKKYETIKGTRFAFYRVKKEENLIPIPLQKSLEITKEMA